MFCCGACGPAQQYSTLSEEMCMDFVASDLKRWNQCMRCSKGTLHLTVRSKESSKLQAVKERQRIQVPNDGQRNCNIPRYAKHLGRLDIMTEHGYSTKIIQPISLPTHQLSPAVKRLFTLRDICSLDQGLSLLQALAIHAASPIAHRPFPPTNWDIYTFFNLN